MRITTQMLNRTSMRTGIPLQRGSLLNYINQTGTNSNDLLKALQTKVRNAENNTVTANRTKFEKQGKEAENLQEHIKRLRETGEKSLYETCKEKEDTTPLCEEAQKLTEDYNRLLSAMKNQPDAMDQFYQHSLTDLVESNQNLLAEIGITADKDGKLQVDTEKMKGVTLEKMQEVLGEKSDFMSKLKFLAGRISERSQVNVQSVTGSYSPLGNMQYYTPNKYNFWG